MYSKVESCLGASGGMRKCSGLPFLKINISQGCGPLPVTVTTRIIPFSGSVPSLELTYPMISHENPWLEDEFPFGGV